MNQLLKLGQQINGLSSGLTAQVDSFLGGGGQGEVYRASVNGHAVAVKWFFPHYLKQDARLRERLERAVRTGAPSDRFLWPLELAATPGDPRVAGFGYIMDLREPRFKGMVDLVTRRVEPSFRALVTAAFELAHSYLQLHARGFCYRDISFGNVFFDPTNGEVRICDNDNVDIDGQPGTIGGTARFMAPELVTGLAAPSTQTDLFSLAVLLFYLLLNHHPLEGARETAIRCFDLPAMTKLYGTEPVFIFDPLDDSNRPQPGFHDNALAFWPLYPQFVRDLFIRAFTAGIRDSQQGRVRESEWRAAMIRLRDAIFYCPQCGAECFYDTAALHAGPDQTLHGQPCWSCHAPLRPPLRIRIAYAPTANTPPAVVVLNHDTALFPHHTDLNRAYDFDQPVAEVSRHPQDPRIWGLKNVSVEPWTAVTASGEMRSVDPGRSLTLAAGTRIQFGSGEGEVRF